MSVRDFPPRPQGATPDSVPYQNWLDALGQRQNIDLLQELTSVADDDEIAIFDASETGNNKTKKISKSNLLAGVGGVSGPVSSTDNAIALWDGTDGDALKDSAVLLSSLMAYADGRFKVGSFTRDMTTASGTQAITGVGFEPRSMIFGSASSGAFGGCVGVSDVTGNVGFQFTNGSGFFPNVNLCIYIAPADISNFQFATISAVGSDGFTVNWTKVGTPTGTATVWYLALR